MAPMTIITRSLYQGTEIMNSKNVLSHTSLGKRQRIKTTITTIIVSQQNLEATSVTDELLFFSAV